jgi:hypothetical protein
MVAQDSIDKYAKKQAERNSGEKPKVGDVMQLSVHEVDTTINFYPTTLQL